MSSIATEIMSALENISYMDILNITNIILEYDDAENKFIKDKTNPRVGRSPHLDIYYVTMMEK